MAAHWFEPIEDLVEAVQQVRDDLVAAGDVQVASLLSIRLLGMLLDSAETLDVVADEIASFLAFAERTGSSYGVLSMIGYRQLVRALQGRPSAPGSFSSLGLDEAEYRTAIGSYGPAVGTYHANRALAALIFDDATALDEHSAAA